jgi:sortase B
MRRTMNILVVFAALALIGFAVAALLGIRAEYDRGNTAYENLNSDAVQTNSTILVAARTENDGTQASAENGETVPITVDFDKLLAQNPDVRGWIYCEGTNISYPILQGQDNQYYIHRLIDGSEAAAGSIFMDYRNSSNFGDLSTVIYGHHMRDGSMFGDLTDYASQSYYDAHPTFWILTPEANYRVDVLAGFVTPSDSDSYSMYSNSGEFHTYLEKCVQQSDFVSNVRLSTVSRTVTLSTCSSEYENARYVVIGSLVRVAE